MPAYGQTAGQQRTVTEPCDCVNVEQLEHRLASAEAVCEFVDDADPRPSVRRLVREWRRHRPEDDE